MNLKQKLSRKLKKTGGFTLIEMLIVVAIIAILVAVSIPMVSSSLEKARKATDDANERAAKSAAMIEYMINGSGTGAATYHYNAESGKAIPDSQSSEVAAIKDYGQGSKKDASSDSRTTHVIVTFDASGNATISWKK